MSIVYYLLPGSTFSPSYEKYLNIFSTFFIQKTLSNAKYEYGKIQRKILLQDALAMTFIDFGLLHSQYCEISYLLADIKIRVEIWQPTHDSVCEDNSWIHGKCRQRFSSNLYRRFPKFFSRFSCILNGFFIFIWTFITSMMYYYNTIFRLSTQRQRK